MANAQSASDSTPPPNWDEIFAQVTGDQTAVWKQSEWQDFTALGYAKSKRSDAAALGWLPQPLPAVDGVNGKIAVFGGGANHSNDFYGTSGSLAFPLAQQWGVQIDGEIEDSATSVAARGAGHLFWRDPSIGLLGAYGFYSHQTGNIIGTSISRFAPEGEYYLSRWTLRGLAGYETVRLDASSVAGLPGTTNRFFDQVSASYYLTDNFKLAIGHDYCTGRHSLILSGEHGYALGGGLMASLFATARFAEGGDNSVLGGLRLYFGQRDKTLIDRNRQDDPQNTDECVALINGGVLNKPFLNPLPSGIK